MSPVRVLLLAGTTEASQLAGLLAPRVGIEVVASLAGRTATPAAMPCAVRSGGFGGPQGLVRELQAGRYHALVDATHPFAARMPGHAREAADLADVPRLRLLRPPWEPGPGDHWHEVDTLAAAASMLPGLGARRVLLTIGRQELDPFAAAGGSALAGMQLIVRSIDPLPVPTPAHLTSIAARPPFTVADETALLAAQRIDTLVTRNSGGGRAKLIAAAGARIAVVMVRRPAVTPGPQVATAAEALEWLLRLPHGSASPGSGPEDIDSPG